MPIIPKRVSRPWIKKSEPKRDREHDPFYSSTAWKKMTKRVAIEEPLCRECKSKGITKAGQVTDHIIQRILRPDLSLDRDNLQRLCNSCHAVKSALEGKKK